MDKNYWDKIYGKKSETEVSWYQEVPVRSLELIGDLKLDSLDSIIDIGGGDSRLVDNLLAKGLKIFRFWTFLPRPSIELK